MPGRFPLIAPKGAEGWSSLKQLTGCELQEEKSGLKKSFRRAQRVNWVKLLFLCLVRVGFQIFFYKFFIGDLYLIV